MLHTAFYEELEEFAWGTQLPSCNCRDFGRECMVSHFVDSHESVIFQVIRPFLLRRKKAEVEKFLPGKTQVILKCDLSAWQRLYYQQIIDSGRVGLDAGTANTTRFSN
jgi:SNF2 family DNA or RNA helicase